MSYKCLFACVCVCVGVCLCVCLVVWLSVCVCVCVTESVQEMGVSCIYLSINIVTIVKLVSNFSLLPTFPN